MDGLTDVALGLCRHTRRRAPFLPLFAPIFHEVSPCYYYRHAESEETPEQYVARLAKELDSKFHELGSDTVAAFFMEPGESALVAQGLHAAIVRDSI